MFALQVDLHPFSATGCAQFRHGAADADDVSNIAASRREAREVRDWHPAVLLFAHENSVGPVVRMRIAEPEHDQRLLRTGLEKGTGDHRLNDAALRIGESGVRRA
jgi:hypothetical protein